MILNVLLDFAFIKLFGMVGAAWSSLVAFTVVLAWRMAFLRKKHGLWPFDASTFRTALLGAALVALLWFLPLIGQLWTNAIVRIALVTVLFWPAVYFLRLAPDLSEQAATLKQRFLNTSR